MDRRTIAIVASCLLAGYLLACPASPLAPRPEPERPILRLIARAAKNLLWIALLAESPPDGPQPDHHVARSHRTGEDGYPAVDNGSGW